jgi:hypothetical protein
MAKLKAEEFKAPQKISADDFQELCEFFSIPPSRRQQLQRELDDLSDFLWDRMFDDKFADGDRLERICSLLSKAVDEIDRLGSSGRDALQAISKDLEAGISATRALQSKARGGPKPIHPRHSLIYNLADIWIDLGNKVVESGPKSKFPIFCERVARSLGWPVEGMQAATAKAVKDWRNSRQKKC